MKTNFRNSRKNLLKSEFFHSIRILVTKISDFKQQNLNEGINVKQCYFKLGYDLEMEHLTVKLLILIGLGWVGAHHNQISSTNFCRRT